MERLRVGKIGRRKDIKIFEEWTGMTLLWSFFAIVPASRIGVKLYAPYGTTGKRTDGAIG